MTVRSASSASSEYRINFFGHFITVGRVTILSRIVFVQLNFWLFDSFTLGLVNRAVAAENRRRKVTVVRLTNCDRVTPLISLPCTLYRMSSRKKKKNRNKPFRAIRVARMLRAFTTPKQFLGKSRKCRVEAVILRTAPRTAIINNNRCFYTVSCE